jgi:hypothetical protein
MLQSAFSSIWKEGRKEESKGGKKNTRLMEAILTERERTALGSGYEIDIQTASFVKPRGHEKMS